MSNVVSVSSKPYGKTASWYDAIYAARGRDADAEVESLSRYFEADGRTVQTRRLLDVVAGRRVHLRALSRYGTVEGVDPSSSMLEVARERAQCSIAPRIVTNDVIGSSVRRRHKFVRCDRLRPRRGRGVELVANARSSRQ